MKKIIYWDRLLSLLTCFLLIAVIALQHNGRLFNSTPEEIEALLSADDSDRKAVADTVQLIDNDTLVVHTQSIGQNIVGYGGNTPLHIYIKDNSIVRITADANSETPDFFRRVMRTIPPAYIGHTPDEANAIEPDVVSGATFTSIAVRENIKVGAAYAQSYLSHNPIVAKPSTASQSPMSLWQLVVALAVVLSAALVPLFTKKKIYRLIQLLLNVIILGLWCGTFISYSLIVNVVSNGINLATMGVAVAMLVVAIIYCLFGQGRHYCMWLCPLGSAQELIWRLSPLRRKGKEHFQKLLLATRWTLWAVLMIFMLTGVWTEWMNYELFSIFLFSQASWVVIVLAAIFLVLSLFVQRPYCKYLCPTGCLMQAATNRNANSPF